MKTKPLSTLVIASVLAVGSTLVARGNNRQQAPAEPDPPVTIEFVKPADYTDFGSSYQPTEGDRTALAEQFREELIPLAKRYVPQGHHLTLRFLDIDMAGDFEPERGAQLADVRVMRSVYPPRLSVEYRVTGPSGEVVSSGRRAISDLDYKNVVTFRRDERLFYETELAAQLIREIMRTV